MIGIIGLISTSAFSDFPAIEDMFFKANNHYQAQEYTQAITLYEAIVQQGFRSGALFYNLGNAYYKTGAIGRALVNYERARLLIPHDEDLFANMKLVEAALKEKQPDDENPWYTVFFTEVRDCLSGRSWVTIALGLYFMLIAQVLVLIFVPTYRAIGIPLLTMMIVLTFFVMAFAGLKVREESTTRLGIIVAEAVDVRYSPAYTGSVAFTIHEGLKARIIREEKGWVQIRFSRGNSGWIERDAIEVI